MQIGKPYRNRQLRATTPLHTCETPHQLQKYLGNLRDNFLNGVVYTWRQTYLFTILCCKLFIFKLRLLGFTSLGFTSPFTVNLNPVAEGISTLPSATPTMFLAQGGYTYQPTGGYAVMSNEAYQQALQHQVC